MMKKIRLFPVLMILLSYSAQTQTGFGNFGNVIKNRKSNLSFDYPINSTIFKGGRVNLALQVEDYYEVNFFSAATIYEGNKLRVSSNALVMAVVECADQLVHSIDSSSSSSFTAIPIIIQVLTNQTFKKSLFKDNLYVTFGIKTDYYLLNDDPFVYSEGAIGLRGQLDKLALEANVAIPFAKGNISERSAYIGLKVFYSLK